MMDRSLAQTPQYWTRMSTSVSSHVLGVNECRLSSPLTAFLRAGESTEINV